MGQFLQHDITVIYYTANHIPAYFGEKTRGVLKLAIYDYPLVSVSHKPMDFGDNIVVDLPRSHLSIYKQALVGAKAAKTKYIALAEDDVLYSPEHFQQRPSPGKFAYNIGVWSMYTWEEPAILSWKGRKNLGQLICERELFIEAMEERFAKWPEDDQIDLGIWAEPGKYERNLGVTIRDTETFYTNPANIMFFHQDALSFDNLGTRKRLGELRAYSVPFWGDAAAIKRMYQP